MAPLIVIQITALMCLILSFVLVMFKLTNKPINLIWYLILLMFCSAIASQTLVIPASNYIFN